LYELVIIFALTAGSGAALEKHTAGPYGSQDECDKARAQFVSSVAATPGVALTVHAACLHLPAK
jgi:hypothetical protein